MISNMVNKCLYQFAFVSPKSNANMKIVEIDHDLTVEDPKERYNFLFKCGFKDADGDNCSTIINMYWQVGKSGANYTYSKATSTKIYPSQLPQGLK